LPVTKAWLRQLILALTLICHSSLRGVVELFGDVFDCSISVGTVHNVLQAAVAQARLCNEQQDLGDVRIGAHDEIFQSGRPVLVGVDADSTYCYLLSLEDHRDADRRMRPSALLPRCNGRKRGSNGGADPHRPSLGRSAAPTGRKPERSPWPPTWPRC
jgi:hypothetical protein